jgi:hypothetical protein
LRCHVPLPFFPSCGPGRLRPATIGWRPRSHASCSGSKPVEPFDLAREELATELTNLGAPGARAAQRLHSERSVEPDPRGSMRELRAQTEPERDTLAAAQANAASELFSAGAAERGLSGHDAATRLIAASLLDDDPLVQAAAAAAALRVDSRNPVAEAILGEAAGGSDEIAELSRAVLAHDRRSETHVIEIEYPAGAPRRRRGHGPRSRHVGARGPVVATRRLALRVRPGSGRAVPTLVPRSGPVQVVRLFQLPRLGQALAGLESTASCGLARLVGPSQAGARARPDRPQLRRKPHDDGDSVREAGARHGAAVPRSSSNLSSGPGQLRATTSRVDEARPRPPRRRLQALAAAFPAKCDAAPRRAEGSHGAQRDS